MIKIIILIVLYLLYKIGFIGKLVNTSLPFILGFVLAYIFYPLLKKLNEKMPKLFSIGIIILLILLFIFLLIYIIVPTLIKEGPNLIYTTLNYIYNISVKYNINIDIMLSKINNIINYNYIINGISLSIGFIANLIVIFISFIYFLYYMDDIKNKIKNTSLYRYLNYVNNDFSKYIGSLIKISIISFFEYTIAFITIGHPNALLIGIIAGILNMIPYIGGIVTVLITILLCPSMIIKISVLYIILGLIDGYIICPIVYGKYNKINPLLGLFSLSIGSIFGFIGIISSFPILVIIMSTINYSKDNNIKIDYFK